MVAACISAETGVGPSMASGNQVCNPNWADFPTAPINNKIHMVVKVSSCRLQKSKGVSTIFGAHAKAEAKFTLLHCEKRAIIPKAKPISPTRFTNIAFIDALEACNRVNQKLISK